jgi:hypothetical protein
MLSKPCISPYGCCGLRPRVGDSSCEAGSGEARADSGSVLSVCCGFNFIVMVVVCGVTCPPDHAKRLAILH